MGSRVTTDINWCDTKNSELGMKVSVICTTYNRPDALAMVLQAFAMQTDLDFELIIADDGSTLETKVLIETMQNRMPYSIQHVWHEDQGFRAAAIRNLAVKAAGGDYLIFIDGDCLPLPHFIQIQKKLAEKNWFVAGNRILLTQTFTKNILKNQLKIFLWPIKKWYQAYQQGLCNRFLALMHLPLGFLRKLQPKKWRTCKTCNLSLFKADLVKVNGFDESFEGWGYEDSDLVIRLLHAGVKRKAGRFAVSVLHLWHADNTRVNQQENYQKLMAVLKSDRMSAIFGLNNPKSSQ